MTVLFLIRHGETPWTRERRFQGSTNTHLSSRGKRQAAALARSLKRQGLHYIYASDLWRARETADIIAKASRKKISFDKRLRELGFGEWEGRTSAELWKDKKSRYRDWCRGKIVTPKKGEPMPALQKRIRGFLNEICRKHPGKRIAVVTHGGPVKIFLYEALQLPFRSLWSFRIEPASMTVIGLGKHFAQALCVNDTAHLIRKGKRQ